nr:vesicle-associated membrane protein 3 [Podarcis muralis]
MPTCPALGIIFDIKRGAGRAPRPAGSEAQKPSAERAQALARLPCCSLPSGGFPAPSWLRSRRRLAASPSSASCSWGWGLSPAGGAELRKAPPSGRACKSCSPKRHPQQPGEQQKFVGESRCCATTSPNVTMSTSGPSGAASAPGSSRLHQTQNQVDEVVDIMRVNVDKVLERDEKLSVLDDRVDALQAGAAQFETNAAKLKRKYWWKNCKMWAILIAVVVVLLIIIIVWSVSS